MLRMSNVPCRLSFVRPAGSLLGPGEPKKTLEYMGIVALAPALKFTEPPLVVTPLMG